MWERHLEHASDLSALSVVIPVKDPQVGKSRLYPPGTLSRSELATAFYRDTVTAVCQAGARVTVVSTSRQVGAWCERSGAEWVPDVGGGLNVALRATLRQVAWNGPVMVLMGDLPCLRTSDLHEIYAQWRTHPHPSFFPDHRNTGTVGAIAHSHSAVPLHFGPGSAARLLDLGVSALKGSTRLRHDVDTWPDLLASFRLGLGRHTAELWELARHSGCMPQGRVDTHPCGQRPALSGKPEGR